MIESKVARIGRLHVLTDFRFQQRWPASKLTEMAIAGGADMIQFRQKRGPISHRLYEADLVAGVCRSAGIPLIVNDSIDIGLAVGAAGIHLGQGDFPIDRARNVLGDSYLLGATTTTTAEAVKAQAMGADYVGFGPVFDTTSKDNLASVKGLDGLESVCAAVAIPVIAIAGITPGRIKSVFDAGAYGVAVMTAVSLSEDPRRATADLAGAVANAVGSRSAIAT